ncbi:substrate-binding domain-containing protein [Amycolatopsis roodepoortensis]|uniref:Ca-activated chloride channel family protein n=1 Tax=Amycolatopsis roodepoortensis TaxID=700274 RepID=A0ABR9LGR0_9PSEU|nr:substrate-binding and VWA domain-containing protein [Amycolatopsis roodepoortensis]MBE1579876.1 Ca-activated chloride channel family protein [Amycolatopsis roodepoortensis]
MRRTGWLSLVFGALVGTLVIVLLATMVTPPSNATRPDCVRLITSSSTEKGDLIAELAERYNNTGRTFDGGRCARVEAHKKTSGATLDLIADGWNDLDQHHPEPQVWLPSSSLWLDLLRQRGKGERIKSGPKTSLATSPMVIAMPEPMAKAMGWPGKTLGWGDVLEVNRNGGWASKGAAYAQWGNFTLGKDNPRRSTSGLAATIATYFAATGGDYGKIGTAETVQFVRGIEASVAYYSDDSVAFLKTLYDEDRKKPTPYISAMAMQEQMVYLYNRGVPTGDPAQLKANPVPPLRPLVAVHPREGTMLIDHPFLVTANASPEQQSAAKDFYDFLLEAAQQDRFRELGFRDPGGNGTPELAGVVGTQGAQEPPKIGVPTGEQIQKMLDGWEYTQRRGRILLVLDLSGSMNEPFDKNRKDKPYSESRIALLKPAIRKQLEYLHPEDEVGLWTFSDGYEEKMPIGKVKNVRGPMLDLVENLTPKGDTALYQTVMAANEKMRREFDPNLINAVVFLTDGENTEAGTKEQVLQNVDAERLDNSVRIFTMAYGAQADSRVLDEIAQKSKARSYQAVDPHGIDKMFVNVFSNF